MVPLTFLLQVATEYGAVASRGAGASDASSGTVSWTISSALDAMPVPPWALAVCSLALWVLLRRRSRGGGLMLGAVMIAAVVGTLVYVIARSQNLL
jgi:hypothetical protein